MSAHMWQGAQGAGSVPDPTKHTPLPGVPSSGSVGRVLRAPCPVGIWESAEPWLFPASGVGPTRVLGTP